MGRKKDVIDREGYGFLEAATTVFNKNFLRLFKDWGQSQARLSKLIGVSQSRITYWIYGKATPSFVNLYNLSKVFGCRLDDFYLQESIENI